MANSHTVLNTSLFETVYAEIFFYDRVAMCAVEEFGVMLSPPTYFVEIEKVMQ